MNDALIHLGTVHFPIALAIIATLLVIFALVTKSPARLKFALEIIVIGAVLSWVPKLTGDGAEDIVDHQPGINDVDLSYYIHHHEEMADKAHFAFQVAGVLALAGWFFVGRKAEKFSMPLAIVMLIAIGATAGLMGVTGHRGGMIRHTELRDGSKTTEGGADAAPKTATPDKETDDDDH